MESLWPDFRPEGSPTPLAILRRQAQLLFRKTSGLLEGEVVTEAEAGQFVHSFRVIAPALGNFRYHMFDLSHGFKPYYPLQVRQAGELAPDSRTTIHSEAELLAWLKSRFEAEMPILQQLWNDSLPDSEFAHTR